MPSQISLASLASIEGLIRVTKGGSFPLNCTAPIGQRGGSETDFANYASSGPPFTILFSVRTPWFLNCSMPRNMVCHLFIKFGDSTREALVLKKSYREACCYRANEAPTCSYRDFFIGGTHGLSLTDSPEPSGLGKEDAACSLLRASCNHRKPGSLTSHAGIIFSKSRHLENKTMRGHRYKFQWAQPLGKGHLVAYPFRYRGKLSLSILV